MAKSRRKILLATKGRADARSTPAVELAAELARAWDAELVVLRHSPPIDPRRAFDVPHERPGPQASAPAGTARTSAAAAGAGAPDRQVHGDVSTLREAAHREEPDLLLVPHRRSGRDRLVRRLGAVPAAVLVARLLDRPARAAAVPRDGRARRLIEALGSFYADPLAWVALLLTSLLLSYGGGAIMFWFHAVYLGEGGPPISLAAHWLLDATAGFIGLTPPLFFILPAAVWAATRGSAPGRGLAQFHVGTYALLGGGVYALITFFGPFVHNNLVGRGTWVAERAVAVFGAVQPPATPPKSVPWLLDGLLQVAVGLPVYVFCTWVGLRLVQGIMRSARALRRLLASEGAAG